VFLSKVVVGRPYSAERDLYDLTAPPAGYDSVQGLPGVHGVLNYDETVVYREAAAIPSYLIVYSTDQTA